MIQIGNLIFRSCFFVSVTMAVLMTGIVIANVISRYFYNYALSWAEEISRYLMVWMVMLGSAMGVRIGAHFRMEMVEHMVSAKTRQLLGVTTPVVFLIFGILLIWQGIILVGLTSYQYATATQIPMSWVYISLPIAGFLMVFFVAEKWIGQIHQKPSSKGE